MACGRTILLACWLILCDLMSSTNCSTYSGASVISTPKKNDLSTLLILAIDHSSGMYSLNLGSCAACGQTLEMLSSGHSGSLSPLCSFFQKNLLRELKMACRYWIEQHLIFGRKIWSTLQNTEASIIQVSSKTCTYLSM